MFFSSGITRLFFLLIYNFLEINGGIIFDLWTIFGVTRPVVEYLPPRFMPKSGMVLNNHPDTMWKYYEINRAWLNLKKYYNEWYDPESWYTMWPMEITREEANDLCVAVAKSMSFDLVTGPVVFDSLVEDDTYKSDTPKVNCKMRLVLEQNIPFRKRAVLPVKWYFFKGPKITTDNIGQTYFLLNDEGHLMDVVVYDASTAPYIKAFKNVFHVWSSYRDVDFMDTVLAYTNQYKHYQFTPVDKFYKKLGKNDFPPNSYIFERLKKPTNFVPKNCIRIFPKYVEGLREKLPACRAVRVADIKKEKENVNLKPESSSKYVERSRKNPPKCRGVRVEDIKNEEKVPILRGSRLLDIKNGKEKFKPENASVLPKHSHSHPNVKVDRKIANTVPQRNIGFRIKPNVINRN